MLRDPFCLWESHGGMSQVSVVHTTLEVRHLLHGQVNNGNGVTWWTLLQLHVLEPSSIVDQAMEPVAMDHIPSDSVWHRDNGSPSVWLHFQRLLHCSIFCCQVWGENNAYSISSGRLWYRLQVVFHLDSKYMIIVELFGHYGHGGLCDGFPWNTCSSFTLQWRVHLTGYPGMQL